MLHSLIELLQNNSISYDRMWIFNACISSSSKHKYKWKLPWNNIKLLNLYYQSSRFLFLLSLAVLYVTHNPSFFCSLLFLSLSFCKSSWAFNTLSPNSRCVCQTVCLEYRCNLWFSLHPLWWCDLVPWGTALECIMWLCVFETKPSCEHHHDSVWGGRPACVSFGFFFPF